MGVDVCDNIYINDYGNIHVCRIPPDESVVETVAILSPPSYWIPSTQWGSGFGNWTSNTLSVADLSGVDGIPVGVPSKHRDCP